MQVKTSSLLQIGLLVNLFEWYECSIYGYLASYLGELFFKTTHPILTLVFGFLPFTVSYLIRPLGSLFFGLIGDKVSRQQSLIISLFMISVPTVLIGLLPTYDQVGNIATVSLIILRLAQGFGAGGEEPIIGCYIFENSISNKKGFLSSTTHIGSHLGFLIGSFTATLLAWCCSPETILSGAWRIPFLLGIPITAYIFYIRYSILTPSIISHKNHDDLISLFTKQKINLLKLILLGSFSAVCYYSFTIWMPIYLTYFINIPPRIASLMNTTVVFSAALFWTVSGYLSDIINYKKLMLYSVLVMLFSILPLFLILTRCSTHYWLLMTCQLFFVLILSGLDALLVLYAANSFPSGIRALGMSLGLTLGASIGGLTPLICTYLIRYTDYLTAPAFYIMAFGLLALPAILTTILDKETKGRGLKRR